jgi:hypothetical protein
VGGLVALLVVLGAGAALAVPALGRQPARTHSTRSAYRGAAAAVAAAKKSANPRLPLKKAKMSCGALAGGTHVVDGLRVQLAERKLGSAAAGGVGGPGVGGPQYCALTGHIARA